MLVLPTWYWFYAPQHLVCYCTSSTLGLLPLTPNIVAGLFTQAPVLYVELGVSLEYASMAQVRNKYEGGHNPEVGNPVIPQILRVPSQIFWSEYRGWIYCRMR